jgi:hypothetical protein
MMKWLGAIAGITLVALMRAWSRSKAPPAKRVRELDESNAWSIEGIRAAEGFFREVPSLLPEATVLYLEGSPAPDVLEVLQLHSGPDEYHGPVGTIWSIPRDQRFSLRASPDLFARLARLAEGHAEPEICSHLHFYREDEPLANWYDAFDCPFFVSRAIPRERVDSFCTALGVEVAPDAAAGEHAT